MPPRRLTPDQKHRILYLYRKGELCKMLAFNFGICQQYVSALARAAGLPKRTRRGTGRQESNRVRAWRHRHRKATRRYERAWKECQKSL
jgi:hypothetical protein